VIEVRQTAEFASWLNGLNDRKGAAIITKRIYRVRNGLLGDVRPVGGGVSELRIDFGPGYRLYFVRRGPIVVILLCGGDKSTQSADIKRAKELASLA
jgi:putative addiction module killer protein